jgi:glycogen synthase
VRDRHGSAGRRPSDLRAALARAVRARGFAYVDGQGQEWKDNAVRFATLSHAAAEIAAGRAGLDWSPQLLHLNDWPVAMAAAYVRWDRTTVPTLLTIHNLAYQGLFRMRLHLCWAYRRTPG